MSEMRAVGFTEFGAARRLEAGGIRGRLVLTF